MAFPDFSLDKEQCLDHTTSDAEQEIVTLLVESRSCSNKDKSLKILHQVKALCEKAMGQNNQMGYELMIETLSDLGNETDLPSKRYKLWQDCLSVAFRGISKFDDEEFVDRLLTKSSRLCPRSLY